MESTLDPRDDDPYSRSGTKMSTTETLQTQLDALQTQFYEIQAENRRLWEENPQQVELVDMERELTQTREENVALVQQINSLTQTIEEASVVQETIEAEKSSLRRTIDGMETEAATFREQIEQECAGRTRGLEETLERAQREGELERFRAVAEVTRRWEEREARWLRRIEELEGGDRRTSKRTTIGVVDASAGEEGPAKDQSVGYVITETSVSRKEDPHSVSFDNFADGGLDAPPLPPVSHANPCPQLDNPARREGTDSQGGASPLSLHSQGGPRPPPTSHDTSGTGSLNPRAATFTSHAGGSEHSMLSGAEDHLLA